MVVFPFTHTPFETHWGRGDETHFGKSGTSPGFRQEGKGREKEGKGKEKRNYEGGA
jgi:hypothetical protein